MNFKNGVHNAIDFEATEQQLCETSGVSFLDCEAVDFIDIEILKKFPKFNNLKLSRSNIPTLKNIFAADLKMIQFLDLGNNNLKIIEAHVFDELVKLKWINLAENKIEEILHPIFAKNKKLEYIDLNHNQIRSLHPKIFDGLDELNEVLFGVNPTINKDFIDYKIQNLKVELKPLFDSYLLKCGSGRELDHQEEAEDEGAGPSSLTPANYKVIFDQNCDLNLELADGNSLTRSWKKLSHFCIPGDWMELLKMFLLC